MTGSREAGAHRRLPASLLAMALCAGLALPGPASAQQPDAPGFAPPPLEVEPPAHLEQMRPRREEPTEPVEPPAVDRGQVLGDLYERLRGAPDEESAGAVVEAIEKVWIRSGSDTIDLLMSRAMRLVREEDFDIALQLLDSVVALEPKYAEGWNQRATVYFLRRDFSSSMRDLRYVLHLDPRHFKAINGMALILQEMGNKEAALRAFRKALEIHPHLDDARQAIRELTREVEGQGI